MSIPPPQRENLYPTLPVTDPFPPNSRLHKTYHSLSPEARLRMLADLEEYRDERRKQPTSDSRTTPTTSLPDKTYHSLSGQARVGVLAQLEKYRYERHKQLIPNSKTTPTTSLTTPYSNPNTVPVPPSRGTKRYCTWRCKSWRRHRDETVCECKCGFEHDIVHPSEWRGTPAEAAWDYSVVVRNGGWGNRQRRVRWADPVVMDALEGEEENEVESEEESEVEREEEEDGEEKWVMTGRCSWEMNGFVSEYPDEEMEDAFEELDTSIYRGTGA